jgi:DNA-binding NarL/FixJ family response regulator
MNTRILLADDHPLVRRGLRQLIEREPGLKVVAEASNGAEAVEKAVAEQVDLAILDVAMPRLTGLQAAELLAWRRPATRVLILSMYDNDQYLLAALRVGALGYLLKSVADEEVVEACRAVLRGERFLRSPVASASARRELARMEAKAAATQTCSPRESLRC